VNKRDNPYTPGAGRKPRTLAGRDQDLESFQSLVERLDAGTYERRGGSNQKSTSGPVMWASRRA
jgi:hypothetical protein